MSVVGEFLVESPLRSFFVFTGLSSLLVIAVHLLTHGGILDPAIPIAIVGVGTASCWLMHLDRVPEDDDDVHE